MIKKIEADGDDFTSFLEVEDMQGMSAEQYATHEIKEMHKSLKEGFSFKNSPILEELKELNNIPESQKVYCRRHNEARNSSHADSRRTC